MSIRLIEMGWEHIADGTRRMEITAGDILFDNGLDLLIGTSANAGLRWSTADADNASLVFFLDNTNRAVHVSSKADVATDWNVAADTDPAVYVHSETTPATDYLKLYHDATTGWIGAVGGTLDITGVGSVSVNEAGADVDFRIESDTNPNIFNSDAGLFGGVGALGLGGAAVNTAFASVIPSAFTAVAATNTAGLRVAPAGVTIPAGTTAIAASFWVKESNYTATGTITNAATVYIEDAPTEGGTGNFALWVDSGTVRMDGIAGVLGVPQTAALFSVGVGGGANHSSTATTIYGLWADYTAPSTATTEVAGVYAKLRTAAASFTVTDAEAINAVGPTLGAGSAITNNYGLRVQNQGATGIVTSYGVRIEAQSGSGTSSYGLYIGNATTLALWVDAGLSRFDDSVLIGATAVGTGAPTNVLVVGSGTAPTSSPADSVTLYSSDDAAGHTIPSFYCEGTNVIATGQADSASSVRVKMRINGTVVTLLAI